MKSTAETLSPTRVKLTVEVPFDELAPSLDAAYASIAKQITIPGFRKGKVPARVIDQRVGRAAVLEEAVNDILPRAYEEALRENDVRPLGRPEVEVTSIEDGQTLTFTAEVDVRPEFDLPDYSGIKVEVDDAEVTDDDVEEQLTALRGRFASLAPVDRAAADGDILLVDLSGAEADGTAVEDLSGNAMSYELGSDGMLPGFDEAVRGATAGETRTFEFTPEVGEFEGKPLTVSVTVSAVRERSLPDADDSFAQMASEFDTIGELRDDIRTRLGRVRLLEQGLQARGKVHEALLELVDFPLPEGAVRAEVEDHFADGHAGDDEHRAEVERNARNGLKSQLILDRIAEAEAVAVGESELSTWLLQNAPRYGMSPDAFAQALMQAGQLPMAIADIRRSKALAVVTQKASVYDASGRPVDLEALDADLRAAEAAGEVEVIEG
ncbi:MAG: trigger factor [Candidatus Nanopelagicales bacterium]